jgi:predicted dehydrogenase
MRMRTRVCRHHAPKPVRYAVVGLGHIAQQCGAAGVRACRRNWRLAALVSDDPVKLKTLARKYRVAATYGYDQYEDCLREVDAVYIALPNSMRADYTIRAASAGV